MSSRGVTIVVVLLCTGAGVGFFAWRKLRRHEVLMRASGHDCRGRVEVEENSWRDGEPLVKRAHSLGDDGPATTVNWTSPPHHERAGTAFAVLIRGDCHTLSCGITIDGAKAGEGRGEGGQVSCTAALGN